MHIYSGVHVMNNNGDPFKSGDDGSQSGKSTSSLDAFFRSLQGLTNQALSSRLPTNSAELLEFVMRLPDFMVNMGKAGNYLKDLRETAGLSIDELAQAINLDNSNVLKDIEQGEQPVTLDVLYRLASFHARNDPLKFMMDFSREHAPLLWQI